MRKDFDRFGIAAALLATVAGCSSMPGAGFDAGELAQSTARIFDTRPVPASLPPAPRPSFARGDTFIYGATTVRRVSASNAQGVEWTTQRNELQRGSRDFFAPFHLYETPVSRIDSTLVGEPGKLWPLQVGNKVSFEESRRVTWKKTGHSRTQQLRWECEVVDTRMSYVPAGDFASYHVACRSYYPGFFLPVQVISWDYAPSIGHYVRRAWIDGRRSREMKLSAALPGKAATPARVAAVLERLAEEAKPK